jgi:excisionase family DNA binding protein
MNPETQSFHRVRDVVRMLSLCRSVIYGMIHSGELPHVRFGKAVRIPDEALRAYIEKKTQEALVRRSKR